MPSVNVGSEICDLCTGIDSDWAVLLPLDSLRRLTVPEEARNSKDLQSSLALMPQLHTVIYHGPHAGEGYHWESERLGSPWMQHIPIPDDGRIDFSSFEVREYYSMCFGIDEF